MKTFNIHSWQEMKHIDPMRDHIIISVNEPGEEARDIAINRNCKDVLRLWFDDAEPNWFEKPEEARSALKGRDLQLMTADHANQIWDFVLKHPNVDHIIVHCTAGLCRSPAIGAAISRVFNGRGRDQTFFDRFMPNMHVFRTMLEAAFERKLWNPGED